MEKIVLIAGTFDPITTGHLDIIKRAADTFDGAVVAVYTNPAKKPLLNEEIRLSAVAAATSDMANVRVVKGEGLIADFAKKLGVCAIVKGVRNLSDYAYEEDMARANRAISGIETLLMFSSPEVLHVSSTLVRELARCGKPYSEYIPEGAKGIIAAKLGEKI